MCGVDLGTAITFDAISANAEYWADHFPGIGISTGALFARTARLPKVDIRDPGKLIGTNTVGSIQSGLFWGNRMIDSLSSDSSRSSAPANQDRRHRRTGEPVIRGSRGCGGNLATPPEGLRLDLGAESEIGEPRTGRQARQDLAPQNYLQLLH